MIQLSASRHDKEPAAEQLSPLEAPVENSGSGLCRRNCVLVNLAAALNELDRHKLARLPVLHELSHPKISTAYVFDHLELGVVGVHLGHSDGFLLCGRQF